MFLNLPSLRQKVAAKGKSLGILTPRLKFIMFMSFFLRPSARLYGIRDVSEEFLILLSHATQVSRTNKRGRGTGSGLELFSTRCYL